MGFFTQRERADLNKPTHDMEGKIPEFVRRDYAPRRRAPEHDASRVEPPENYAPRWRPSENNRVDGNAGRRLEQMSADAIDQIDRLLVELRAHRERLLTEGAHVQRALVEYARFCQSTMQSTKIIAESLTHLKPSGLDGASGEMPEVSDSPGLADHTGAEPNRAT